MGTVRSHLCAAKGVVAQFAHSLGVILPVLVRTFVDLVLGLLWVTDAIFFTKVNFLIPINRETLVIIGVVGTLLNLHFLFDFLFVIFKEKFSGSKGICLHPWILILKGDMATVYIGHLWKDCRWNNCTSSIFIVCTRVKSVLHFEHGSSPKLVIVLDLCGLSFSELVIKVLVDLGLLFRWMQHSIFVETENIDVDIIIWIVFIHFICSLIIIKKLTFIIKK